MGKLTFLVALAVSTASLTFSQAKPLGNVTQAKTNIGEPNFLDYVKCEAQPENICTLVLVMSQTGQDMGGLVINNECDKVVSLAHKTYFNRRAVFSQGNLPRPLIVEPRPHGHSVMWYGDLYLDKELQWSTYPWNRTGFWHDQTIFWCGI